MQSIKSYTDIEQSRKLTGILPIESADMYYGYGKEKPEFLPISDADIKCLSLPCWSLSALLSVLPKPKVYYSTDRINRWYCECWDIGGNFINSTKASNPIDACVDMIEKLHRLNLL